MIQRLFQIAQATADANGDATFVFYATPVGLVWTGTVGVDSAPDTAVMSARVGIATAGDPWGSWTGNGTFGPVQAWAMYTLAIDATGLSPGRTYTSRWIGDSRNEWEGEPVSPTALTTAIIGGGTTTRTFSGTSNQGMVESDSPVFATMGAGAGLTLNGGGDMYYAGQRVPADYNGYQSFFEFDTSAIPDSATIISATLALCVNTLDAAGAAFTLEARMHTFGAAVTTADWQPYATFTGSPGNYPLAASIPSASMTVGTLQDLVTAAGLAAGINKTGVTQFILVTSREFAATVPTGPERCLVETATCATVGKRPVLTVVSSA